MVATDARTHIGIFCGQMTQMNVGSSFPSTQEDPMYLSGAGDDGLYDGDIYFANSGNNEVMGVHIGSNWQFITFTPA